MTKSIFETKEQYLAFRAAFAAAQNDKRAKHYFVEELTQCWDHETKKWGKMPIKTRRDGWLQAEHFIILNAIRDKPLDRGFTPITSKNKLAAFQSNPMYAFEGNLKYLKSEQEKAKLLQSPYDITISPFEFREFAKLPAPELADAIEKIRRGKMDRIEQELEPLLEPFAGTLTIEQFAALNLGE